jgi:hypothetical protein
MSYYRFLPNYMLQKEYFTQVQARLPWARLPCSLSFFCFPGPSWLPSLCSPLILGLSLRVLCVCMHMRARKRTHILIPCTCPVYMLAHTFKQSTCTIHAYIFQSRLATLSPAFDHLGTAFVHCPAAVRHLSYTNIHFNPTRP